MKIPTPPPPAAAAADCNDEGGQCKELGLVKDAHPRSITQQSTVGCSVRCHMEYPMSSESRGRLCCVDVAVDVWYLRNRIQQQCERIFGGSVAALLASTCVAMGPGPCTFVIVAVVVVVVIHPPPPECPPHPQRKAAPSLARAKDGMVIRLSPNAASQPVLLRHIVNVVAVAGVARREGLGAQYRLPDGRGPVDVTDASSIVWPTNWYISGSSPQRQNRWGWNSGQCAQLSFCQNVFMRLHGQGSQSHQS